MLIVTIIIEILTANLSMHLHHSPIRIVNHVNIPEISTPLQFKTNHQEQYKNRKSIFKTLQAKRAQVIVLKDGKMYENALKKVDQLIKMYPEDIRNYQIKGEIEYLMKFYPEALKVYQKILDMTNCAQNIELNLQSHQPQQEFQNKLSEHNRMRALYLYNKALCQQKMGKFNQAIQTIKQSIEMNKNKIESYILMAEIYRQTNNFEKIYKIYKKIINKNPHKSQYLFKVIKLCWQSKHYNEMLTFIQSGRLWWAAQSQKCCNNEAVLNELYKYKGDALFKLKRYNEAIQIYLFIINNQLNQNKLVKIYNKLALCYDFTGDLAKSCDFLTKILLITEDSIETLNNLANLLLRREQYHQALNILNSGILKLLAHTTLGDSSFQLIMLRCHRVIAFSKINMISEAKQDMNEIVSLIRDNKFIEMSDSEQWQNFKFVRYIVDRYEKCLVQLTEIKKQQNHQNRQQIQHIQKDLISSITDQLNKQPMSTARQSNLQQLSERIDRLYSEIVNFKKATLQQHQENTSKVHNKINEIQQIINKKEQQTIKLQKELSLMKEEHQNIYNFIIQNKQNISNTKFNQLIQRLKSQNKHQVIIYIQKMYWIFNAYLISIRLVANGLVSQGSNNLHINKVSSFFKKFKKVFQCLSKLPQIGVFCQIITSIMTLYLAQQSNLIYDSLNKIITTNYFLEKDLQFALESAVINLANSPYIQESLKQYKKDSIAKEMSVYPRAYEWFKEKKTKLIERLFSVPLQESPEQKFIQDLVIEDVSAVFVYLVKNKTNFINNSLSKADVLQQGIDKTLTKGFKKNQINSLYTRENNRENRLGPQEQTCSKCVIYSVIQFRLPLCTKISKNNIYDALIADAIKQNNMQLFNYALNQLEFKFQ